MIHQRVRDAMSCDVVTVPAGATIGSAIDRVLGRGHTHLAVVDQRGGLVDVISARLLTVAVRTRLVERPQPLADILAEPVTVEPETELAEAAAAMLGGGVDALGVVDGSGALVGLLTWTDIGRCATTGVRTERRLPG